jgi:RNA polymerase sigma-70 factor, ECF subfamily
VPRSDLSRGFVNVHSFSRFMTRAATATATATELTPERRLDNELIRASQRGETDAFAELVKLYHARAYWVSYGLLGDEEDARDVVQDAFIRVLGALERFDFSQSFYTWLYRIVVNLSIDRLRRRGKARSVALDDVAEPAAEVEKENVPSDRMESGETKKEVHAVLETLPEKYRTVMVLREINGLSCKEIAKIVHCTHATVRWRLHVARKYFKDAWERRDRLRDKSALGDLG